MRISVVFLAALVGATAVQAATQDSNLQQRRVILVGDSTMALRTGYGTGFCAALKPQLTCENMAKGGRSTKSYREEGSWNEVLQKLQDNRDYKATYVLIQFGHNDQPNKPGRSTDLKTEFPANLRRFVQEVKATGAQPILVSPLTRRMFRNGTLQDTLGPWAEAASAVAAEESVALLDLYRDSSAAIQKLGLTEANKLAMAPPPASFAESATRGTSPPLPPKPRAEGGVEPKGEPGPVFDYTHLGKEGAAFFGRMVASELTDAVPDLRPYVRSQ